MIISNNKHKVNTTRNQVNHLTDQINKNLGEYAKTGLPAVKAEGFTDFATNPKGYFLNQVLIKAKAQGMEGVNPAEYAKLYDLTFAPITGGQVVVNDNLLQYIKLTKGKAVVVDDLNEKTALLGVVETSTPEQEEAAKLLLKLFSDYTYLATLLHGGQSVFSAGCNNFGFNAMAPGQLTIETVNKLALGIDRLPREEYNKRLEAQVGNPGLTDVNNPKI